MSLKACFDVTKLNEYLEVFVPPKCGVQICQSWKIQTHCLLWVTKLISLKLEKPSCDSVQFKHSTLFQGYILICILKASKVLMSKLNHMRLFLVLLQLSHFKQSNRYQSLNTLQSFFLQSLGTNLLNNLLKECSTFF